MTNDIGSMIYSSLEQFQGGNVSYPTDIYSLGLLIYYLSEKRDLYSFKGTIHYIINDEEIPSLSHAPSIIQSIFTKCIKFSLKTRITKQEIEIKYNDNFFTSFCQQFSLSQETPAKEQLIYESFITSSNSILYLFFGMQSIIKQDYNKAKENYEISAKQNNSYAFELQ